jgi:hypothetical protein
VYNNSSGSYWGNIYSGSNQECQGRQQQGQQRQQWHKNKTTHLLNETRMKTGGSNAIIMAMGCQMNPQTSLTGNVQYNQQLVPGGTK